jgi:hypothetical protein
LTGESLCPISGKGYGSLASTGVSWCYISQDDLQSRMGVPFSKNHYCPIWVLRKSLKGVELNLSLPNSFSSNVEKNFSLKHEAR